MTCHSKEKLEQMLEDVVNELDRRNNEHTDRYRNQPRLCT
jgi:hypothetical protein